MKLLSRVLAIALFTILTNVDTAESRIIGRRRNNTSTGSYGEYKETKFSTEKRYDFNGEKLSLQDIAQLRAEAMAKHQNMTHGIHSIAKVPAAPVPEGIGVSSTGNYKNVSTCICGSTVIADGWCKGKNGFIYRVRCWR